MSVMITHFDDGYKVKGKSKDMPCDPATYDKVGYTLGKYLGNHPVPAIRYTEELVHGSYGRVHFLVMYFVRDNLMCPVGDSPGLGLLF